MGERRRVWPVEYITVDVNGFATALVHVKPMLSCVPCFSKRKKMYHP